MSAFAILPGVGQAPVFPSPAPVGEGKGLDGGFKDLFTRALDDVNQSQNIADQRLKALASGEDIDLHNTMISLEKADISLRTLVSVRNKALDAYNQLMNMSI